MKSCKCGKIPDLDALPAGYTCMCEAVEQVNNSEVMAKVFPNSKYQPTENTADKLARIKGGNRG